MTQQTHLRQESDEFGSFVSVPATDDPLGAGAAGLGPTSPISASIFDAFGDDAKQRTKENEQRVMDELRAHEEDPLAWLNSSSEEVKSTGGVEQPNISKNTVKSDGESSRSTVDIVHVDDARESGIDQTYPRSSKTDLTQLTALGEETGTSATEQAMSMESLLSITSPSGADPLRHSVLGSDRPSGDSLSSSSASSLGLGEGPKERAKRNESRVLDELRAHDDDPRGWLKSKTDEGDDVPSALEEAGSMLIDLSTPASEAQELPPRSRTPSLSSSSRASTSPRPHSVLRAITSPLISRAAERARSQSPPAHESRQRQSIDSSIGASRSWMATLGLFGTSRAVPASSSPSAARGMHDAPADIGSAGLSPTQSSLHALVAKAGPPMSPTRRHARFATDGHAPVHAATLPVSTASALTLDKSPFASHVYAPPSGAPGFAGDHNWNPGGFEFDTRKKTDGKSVRLLGRNESTFPVLHSGIATALRPHLPPLARLSQSWKLQYSADQHGLSLKTLYARCVPPVIVGGGGTVPGASSGALIAVQDAEGGVFGAWVPEGVHLSHGSFYGGGDSFLWKVNTKDMTDGDELHVYKWTGRNGYVAYCDTDGISFGGGDGHYGLYVDASLVEGTTHPCPTFDNDCLALGERKGRMVAFDAVGIEVWSIGP